MDPILKLNSWKIFGSNYRGKEIPNSSPKLFFKIHVHVNVKIFSLIGSKLDQSGVALVIFYFLSLEKPEFTKFANELSTKSDLTHCFSMLGQLIYGECYDSVYDEECLKVMEFIREYCRRNDWDLAEWLKIQMKVLKSSLEQFFSLHFLIPW